METSDDSFARFSTPFPQHAVNEQRKLSKSFPTHGNHQSQCFDESVYIAPQEWDPSFEHLNQSSGDVIGLLQSAQGASSPILDLEQIKPDLEALNHIDVQSLVKPAGAGLWQPQTWARGESQYYGYQLNGYARSTGVMTEPVQNDDVSSATQTFDSGFASMGQGHFDLLSYAQDSTQDFCYDYSGASGAQPIPRMMRPHAPRFRSDSQVVANPSKRRPSSQRLPVCPFCHKHWPKNKSDQVKHERRHTKPFKCRHDECAAKDVGFATANDLDRHCKSGRHQEAPTKGALKGFICIACTDGKMKWWPRQDNFKAHCNRRHANMNMNIEDIVKLSAHARRPPDTYSADDNNTRVSDAAYQQQTFPQQQDLNSFDVVQPEQAPDLLSPSSFQFPQTPMPPTMQNYSWNSQQWNS